MDSSEQFVPAPQATDVKDPAVNQPDEHRDEAVPPPAGRLLWGEPLRRLIAIALALFAVAAAIAGPTAVRVRGISVFDEATHIDYAYEVAHGHIPARGSVIAPVIRAQMLCRGPARKPVPLPRCGELNPPASTFPVGAQDYNFAHPPLYYAITGVLARGAGLAFSADHFITFARLTGVLWLFAAMLVLYLALRRFGVRWELSVCGSLLLALTPAIFYLDATVSNDAPAALAGSLGLLMLARITVDGKLGWKIPTLLAFLVAATKTLNALPFLAVAAVLLALALQQRGIDKSRAKRLLFIALGIVAAVGFAYASWTIFQNHRGNPNWVNPVAGISSRKAHGLPFDELFGTTFSGLNLASSGYLPPPLANNWMTNMLRLFGPLSIAAAAILLDRHRPWSIRFNVVIAAVVGVLAFPLAVQLEGYVGSGVYFPAIVARYGMSLIPFLLAAIVLAADDKRFVKTLTVFTGVCLLVGVYTVA